MNINENLSDEAYLIMNLIQGGNYEYTNSKTIHS